MEDVRKVPVWSKVEEKREYSGKKRSPTEDGMYDLKIKRFMRNYENEILSRNKAEGRY